jgi:hypothetical protein
LIYSFFVFIPYFLIDSSVLFLSIFVFLMHDTSFSLHTQGTGLGVSSILAATVFAAVSRALGRNYSRETIIHAVLLVEQVCAFVVLRKSTFVLLACFTLRPAASAQFVRLRRYACR